MDGPSEVNKGPSTAVLPEIKERCRAFIEAACIFRSPPGCALLHDANGCPAAWQFYMPVATFNAAFMRAIGELYWDVFASAFKEQPFQLGACESGGVAVALGLAQVAYAKGLAINAFTIKRERKTYGLENWLEGLALEGVPVMLTDDIVGSGNTLRKAAARIGILGFELYPKAFAIASCKRKNPLSFDDINRRIEIKILFEPHDFCLTYNQYLTKYGQPPQFKGSLI